MSYSDANTASPHAPAGASVERFLVRDLSRLQSMRWLLVLVPLVPLSRFVLGSGIDLVSIWTVLSAIATWAHTRQGVIHDPERRQLHVRRVIRTEILDTDLPITANVDGAGERRAVRLTLEQDGRMVPTALLVDRRDLDRLPSIIQLSRPEQPEGDADN